MATCKLGEKGCWKDGKCHYIRDCENKVLTNADRIRAMSDEELVKMSISSEGEFWLLCMLENRRRGNAT